jgi:hypothetical protein
MGARFAFFPDFQKLENKFSCRKISVSTSASASALGGHALKITAITAFPFRLPVRRDFKWAGLIADLGGFVAVRVETEGGVTGFGEATPLPDWGGDWGRRCGETQASVVQMIEQVLAPALVGLDATAVTAARAAMDRVLIGNSYAKCAIDIALHDAWGKIVGQPVYKLLGGAVRPSVPVAHMIGLMHEAEALDEGLGAVADGVQALQIKGGVDLARDVRLVAALRRELGPDITLRLDANQGYGHGKAPRKPCCAWPRPAPAWWNNPPLACRSWRLSRRWRRCRSLPMKAAGTFTTHSMWPNAAQPIACRSTWPRPVASSARAEWRGWPPPARWPAMSTGRSNPPSARPPMSISPSPMAP